MCAVCSCEDTSYDKYFLEVVLQPVTHTVESSQGPRDKLLYIESMGQSQKTQLYCGRMAYVC
jgi:hypothetical protein